jgi:4-oxalocrotonate tautomerase family enzyme
MPVLFFYGPELSEEGKKELIKSFTESTTKVTGIDKMAVTVLLRVTTHEDVGVGGELLRELLEKGHG